MDGLERWTYLSGRRKLVACDTICDHSSTTATHVRDPYPAVVHRDVLAAEHSRGQCVCDRHGCGYDSGSHAPDV